jgi:hypothetical protein
MAYQYKLFISHSWGYSDAYEKLIKLLNNADRFSYSNYSVPKNDPVHNAANARELESAIYEQMRFTHVVVILAGVYASYSKWINKEIQLAKGFRTPKPIIAIEPFAAERTSRVVTDAADRVVAWSTSSIVSAIRELGYQG